ncbi:DUF4190 domain-containing protein [Aeromicrobium sp.]|uniref:DUF4190 domain-containing protein n=1 Tax=Aeromicrobium sp. TaxID=1871063 RepID=UPI0030BAFAE8
MSDQPQYPSYPGSEEPDGQQPSPPPPGYGQAPPSGQPDQPAYGQPAYGQPAYGQAPPAYVQPTYGQAPQAYGQPAYGQPGYGYPAPPSNNNKALWAMITGIVSIFFCYLGVLIGPVAIVLAVLGKKDIKGSNGTQTGDGMATAGLITGIIGTLIWAAVIALIIVGITVGA